MAQDVLREEKPPCFGRIDDPSREVEGFNPNCKQCAGGLDPARKNPITGTHVLDKCMFFNACGAAVQAKKMGQFVDPKTLVRPPQTVQPQFTSTQQPPTQQPNAMQRFAQSMTVHQQNQMQPVPSPPVVYAPQGQQMTPQMMQMMMMQQAAMQQQVPYGYQQMMPVNYQMPAYLSTPEPQTDGYWQMFGRTIFRSMGKSLGHSVAHLFDTIPFNLGKPPKG